jgi:hypothetical protein
MDENADCNGYIEQNPPDKPGPRVPLASEATSA